MLLEKSTAHHRSYRLIRSPKTSVAPRSFSYLLYPKVAQTLFCIDRIGPLVRDVPSAAPRGEGALCSYFRVPSANLCIPHEKARVCLWHTRLLYTRMVVPIACLFARIYANGCFGYLYSCAHIRDECFGLHSRSSRRSFRSFSYRLSYRQYLSIVL